MLGAPFKPYFGLSWDNGSRCATSRLPRPPKGQTPQKGTGSQFTRRFSSPWAFFFASWRKRPCTVENYPWTRFLRDQTDSKGQRYAPSPAAAKTPIFKACYKGPCSNAKRLA